MRNEKLEAEIDKAGRLSVFNYVARMGWKEGSPVPECVWWLACRIVQRQRAAEVAACGEDEREG